MDYNLIGEKISEMRFSQAAVRSFSEATCCLCLQVRTGSILIGLWHLIGQLFAIYLIASMVIRENDDAKDRKETALEYQHDASDYCVGHHLLLFLDHGHVDERCKAASIRLSTTVPLSTTL